VPLVSSDPQDPAAEAIGRAARGLIAMTPVKLAELPLAPGAAAGTAPPAPPSSGERKPAGMSLPMA
jgi:hypothetical protein